MHFNSYLPVALAVLATVDALPWKNAPFVKKPTKSLKKRASVTGKQRRGPGEHKRNIANHMHAAYSKHNIAMLPVLASTLKGQAFNTPLNNDLFYTVPVTVGGQSLELNLDTGSSDLWVWSSLLPQEDFILPHNLYNPAFSNTSRQLNATFDIVYGKGYASGIVFTDNVFFGGIEAQNFPIEVATNISADSVANMYDGLIGMAMPKGNRISPPISGGAAFWASVIDDLDEPLFTVDLNRNRTGAYNFGFIDESRYVGNISYLTVDPNLIYWTVNASVYAIGNATYERPFQGIMDTGTTFTLLPDGLLDNYFAQVPGALDYYNTFGTYLYDCTAELLSLSFTFTEGYTATIDPSYITYAEVWPGVCMSGFQPRGPSTGGDDTYIFDDTFLVSQFVVLNTQPVLQVGLAPKVLDGLNVATGLVSNGTSVPASTRK